MPKFLPHHQYIKDATHTDFNRNGLLSYYVKLVVVQNVIAMYGSSNPKKKIHYLKGQRNYRCPCLWIFNHLFKFGNNYYNLNRN